MTRFNLRNSALASIFFLIFSALTTLAQMNIAYEYYVPFTGTTVKDIPNVSPKSTGGLPNISVPPSTVDQNFAIRLKGFVKISTPGSYTFFTATDDGSMLAIDSTKVVDNDGAHGTTEKSGIITLTAGLHAIEVLYFQGGGGLAFSVAWQGPGITKQAIPDSLIFYESSAHDAAPSGILAPVGIITGATLAPKIMVQNLGQATESFNVFCRIDSAGVPLYAKSQSVTGLASNHTQTLTFPNWNVPMDLHKVYTLSVWTSLAGDLVPANDTLRTTVVVQQAGLSAFPKPYQLYCRNAQDSAAVAVAGSISIPGSDSVSLTIYKNNVKFQRLAQKLQYAGNTAAFAFNPKLHAELSMYKFEIRIDAFLFAAADSVVAGDAFLVEGQSNSCDFSSVAPQPYLRTFGTWSGDAQATASDTAWGIAMTNGHTVNGWGMQIAKKIVDTYSVPICLITGGVGGTSIQQHAPSSDLSTIYGRYRYRILKANLQNGLKWVIWHQGESNQNDAAYKTLFLNLCNSWKTDFPGLQRYYLFQIRPGCLGLGLETIREQQRQIIQGRPDISIMSTTNVPAHDGCHYGPEGYTTFANWMYPLVARDFYKSTDTLRIRPPDIQQATFANSARTRITLRFDQPVLVPTDTSIRNAFAMGNVFTAMDSIKADTVARSLTLFLHSRADSTRLSYVLDTLKGARYEGPWLTNTRGIGALTFYRVPVLDSGTVGIGAEGHLAEVAKKLNAVVGPFSIDIRFEGLHTVKVYSLSGNLLMTKQGDGPARYPVRDQLGKGVYLVRIVTPNFNLKQKMFVY